MACFDDLVPEILFKILRNAQNMHILWGFIRASPRMYRIFCNHRDSILSTIITREIGESIMADAQSALRSSCFERRGLSKPQALEWLSYYQAGTTSSVMQSGTSLGPDLLPLWQMHRDVKYLADLFVRDRLPILISGIKKASGPESPISGGCSLDELSVIEKTRIYRAIYRHAIYGNLFYFDDDRQGVRKVIIPYAHWQSHSFLALFSAWQVEELSCINDFIHDKIVEKWRGAEDSIYARLKDEPLNWVAHSSISSNLSSEIEDFFSHSAKALHHHDWQRYCATLTLSELRVILSADAGQFPQVVRKHTHYYPHDFLTEALDEDPYHSSLITPEYEAHLHSLQSGVKVAFQGDSVDQANEGWLWAHNYQPCELYTLATGEFPIGEGLRRFGYVFWDSWRLNGSGILREDPAVVAQTVSSRFPRPLSHEISVEDRLTQLWRS